jgi:predicted GTPase
LTKYDDSGPINSGTQKIEAVAKDLGLNDPVVISSKTGYGIRRLKNTIRAVLKKPLSPSV